MLARSGAAQTKAEAALAQVTAAKDAELQAAWQEATSARHQLMNLQSEVASLQASNANLEQEQQVCKLHQYHMIGTGYNSTCVTDKGSNATPVQQQQVCKLHAV